VNSDLYKLVSSAHAAADLCPCAVHLRRPAAWHRVAVHKRHMSALPERRCFHGILVGPAPLDGQDPVLPPSYSHSNQHHTELSIRKVTPCRPLTWSACSCAVTSLYGTYGAMFVPIFHNFLFSAE